MDQEKIEEYQQVAAIVCMDMEILLEVCNDSNLTADELRDQIRYTHEKMLEAQRDPKIRRERYSAASMIFGLLANQ